MQTLTEKLATLAGKAGFIQTGESWRIQAVPDIFTGERINVGVGIRLPSGAVVVRVMEAPGRLACFYGEAGAENILFAAKMYKDAVEAGLPSPVENIVESDRQPVFNAEPDALLGAMFFDQVSAARADPKDSLDVQPMKRDALTAKVYAFIRQHYPTVADQIIPQSTMAIVNTERGARTVRVPIQSVRGFAGIESAILRTAQTIQFNLMNALLDVEAAARARNMQRTGLFILRPDSRNENWNNMIDNAIDRVIWRAQPHCDMHAETSVESLSVRIAEFALPQAA